LLGTTRSVVAVTLFRARARLKKILQGREKQS
jgi:DNA-directed RNA polymerase specialized sigma24 family protein